MKYSADTFERAAEKMHMHMLPGTCCAIALIVSEKDKANYFWFWDHCHNPERKYGYWLGAPHDNQMLREQLLGEMAINLREQGYDSED